MDKSFLVLFFKKEPLPLPLAFLSDRLYVVAITTFSIGSWGVAFAGRLFGIGR
jgi:hypothetical protein